MEDLKYLKIRRAEEDLKGGFRKGDHIVIQEKIDGANFSIRYDAKTDSILAYSRNAKLKESNNLRGAWNWAQGLEKEKIKEVLQERYILFGEWLVQHRMSYPKERYNKAYFFDVYDKETGGYAEQEFVKEVVDKLGLLYVPVFYDGVFENWEQVTAFVGRTDLGGEKGEGIIVKNMNRLNDTDEEQPFYVKIVIEEFKEMKQEKMVDERKLKENQRKRAIAESVVTEARVLKLLHKMVDEGILPEDWGEEQLPVLKKHLGGAIYHDCAEEEPETVALLGKGAFGAFAVMVANDIVQEILKGR